MEMTLRLEVYRFYLKTILADAYPVVFPHLAAWYVGRYAIGACLLTTMRLVVANI